MEGDSFEVLVRVGDDNRTAGYAGRAQVAGHAFLWTAEVEAGGIRLNPQPVEPASWDGESWTLEDGEPVDGEELAALMDGLGRTLQGITNGAEAAAAKAYVGAIAAAFGDLPTQRVLFL